MHQVAAALGSLPVLLLPRFGRQAGQGGAHPGHSGVEPAGPLRRILRADLRHGSREVVPTQSSLPEVGLVAAGPGQLEEEEDHTGVPMVEVRCRERPVRKGWGVRPEDAERRLDAVRMEPARRAKSRFQVRALGRGGGGRRVAAGRSGRLLGRLRRRLGSGDARERCEGEEGSGREARPEEVTSRGQGRHPSASLGNSARPEVYGYSDSMVLP